MKRKTLLKVVPTSQSHDKSFKELLNADLEEISQMCNKNICVSGPVRGNFENPHGAYQFHLFALNKCVSQFKLEEDRFPSAYAVLLMSNTSQYAGRVNHNQ